MSAASEARDRLAIGWLRECDLAIIGTVFQDRASATEYERTSRCQVPHGLVVLVPAAEWDGEGDAAVSERDALAAHGQRVLDECVTRATAFGEHPAGIAYVNVVRMLGDNGTWTPPAAPAADHESGAT